MEVACSEGRGEQEMAGRLVERHYKDTRDRSGLSKKNRKRQGLYV